MEINRRNFIALLAGGVAGLHITPLPWKITDDIAIWTQNWPWVPVPPVGAFTSEETVCGLCPGGCGIMVRKVDERAVKIEGRADYPVNPGGICPLGMGGLQVLYNESIRFTGPMKRVGPRGAGTFKNIGWDEAFEILSQRIDNLREKGTPEAVAAVDGSTGGSSVALLTERLMQAIGSPNYVRIPCLEETYGTANMLMTGNESTMAYDLENASFILSFGAGLLEGWGAPGRVLNAWGNWHSNANKGKIKISHIESRASNTASKSDQWVAPKPGTENALALGIAHVLISEGLYNSEFVKSYTFGFEEWSSSDGRNHEGFKSIVLKEYSPEKVSSITGVDAQVIIKLAKEFGGAKAPIAICGKGKGALNGSLLEVMAVQSLNALVGNINRPGGVLVFEGLPLSQLGEISPDGIAFDGLKKQRLDQAGAPKAPFTKSLVSSFTEAILEEEQSPIDTLLVFASNPAYTLPDGGAFRKALKKLPFIVSFSPYRDETALMADLILPDHTYLEKTNDIIWPSGLQYPMFGLTRPVVDPLYDTKNVGDIIIQLAKQIGEKVGSSFPWDTFEDVIKERAKGLFEYGSGKVHFDGKVPVWKQQKEGSGTASDYSSFDDMWEKIKSGGLWYSPKHTYGGYESLFKTPTGKFEFFSTKIELAVKDRSKEISQETAFEELGIRKDGDEAFMPHFEPLQKDDNSAAYDLTLVPYEIINLSSGWLPNPPFLYKTLFDTQLRKEESFADINPKTAERLEVKQGDRVIIESPMGEVRVRANLFDGAMPDVVYLPLGFGHTAYDEFSRGKGENPNDIIYGGKDPLSGHPVWWNTPVKLIKA
ncbi:molybdopterin-dependent oxidoreductase [Thermodesulfobacteriota bacterium]